MAQEKTPAVTKPSFDVAEGKIAVLLFPTDPNDVAKVEELLLQQKLADNLPAVTQEVELARLAPHHVLFTVVPVPDGRPGLKRQVAKYKLQISPAIECSKFFADLTVTFGARLREGDLVDHVQSFVLPFVAKLSNDKRLKIGSV